MIGEHVGAQDQVCAAFGGFNWIEFATDGTFEVSPLILPPGRAESLQSHLMLFFTGFTRIASDIAAAQIANIDSLESELRQMQAMVPEAIEILQDENRSLADFGALLHLAWDLKRRMSPLVSTPAIDSIYARAICAGAIGGKLLGAGGGGFMLLFADPDNHRSIREAMAQSWEEVTYVPFKFENSGSRVVLYQPNGL